MAFTARVVELRKSLDAFRKRQYLKDIAWLTPHGGDMTEADWRLPFARCLGALFREDGVLLLLNAHDGDIPFVLPPGVWEVLLDTAEPARSQAEPTYALRARSLALLRARHTPQA